MRFYVVTRLAFVPQRFESSWEEVECQLEGSAVQAVGWAGRCHTKSRLVRIALRVRRSRNVNIRDIFSLELSSAGLLGGWLRLWAWIGVARRHATSKELSHVAPPTAHFRVTCRRQRRFRLRNRIQP